MNLKFSIFLTVLCSLRQGIMAATPNADDKYQKWADPGRILYQTAPDFDQYDMQVLQAAMGQLSADTSQCIKFQRYDNRADAGKDFIYIANKLSSGKSMASCYSFPGRSVEQQGRGQYMVLFSSRTAPSGSPTAVIPGACLDNIRDAMKYLFHVLGFRSEYGRTDRVNYLDFLETQPNSLVAKHLVDLNPFKVYLPGEASFYNLFDAMSITMVDGKKWARSVMNPVFTPKTNVWIGGKPNLSQQDCQALAMYNCDTLKCQNPYLLNSNGITITPANNPMDANGICFPGQTIQLGSITASGVQIPNSNLPQAQPATPSGVNFGTPVNNDPAFPSFPVPSMGPLPFFDNSSRLLERAGSSPYAFSVVSTNPYNFQVLPDPTNPTKASIVITNAQRGFTNVQITVQANNIANQLQTGQAIIAINLNCGPIFSSFSPGVTGTSSQTRLNVPPSPIKGVVCDGNMLATPVIVGAFTAVDPDDQPITYYLTISNKFQISSSGVLVLIQAPTPEASNIQVNINAMDANGAVSSLFLTVQISCT